ncbi:unnamed protein product, partial [Mesorhabditis spiculigera]
MRKPPPEDMKAQNAEERKPLTGEIGSTPSKPRTTGPPPTVGVLRMTDELPSKSNVDIIIQQPTDSEDGIRKRGSLEGTVLHPDKSGAVSLTIPDANVSHVQVIDGGGLRKTFSMENIRTKLRDQRERFQRHQCAGIILFLILGTICQMLSYLASVWAAQLNAEIIQAAVSNEHALKFNLKKNMATGPSKYLIGLLNFGGRLLSAIGTVLLVQVIVSYCKRRRYNTVLKSAAGESDELIGEIHGGITEYAGEGCVSCFQSLT